MITGNPDPSVIIIAFPSVTSINYFLLPLLSYYCYFHIIPATSASPGAAELTTPMLRLSSILCLPLCRINKLGFTYLEDCCDPLYLWVIKVAKEGGAAIRNMLEEGKTEALVKQS